ncbi:gas vesicle protein GvpG [Halodesulfurarchaeum sp.]|uniref:gas vesicle protein GvpG n=1 Tax=Halodesulfurarchaeum sp. TaxID=1980530 RepID=UPI002FC31714
MLLVDDLLIRPFISILETLQTLALKEMYDIESIQDDLKENQLLYELGERTKAEYEQQKAELESELKIAESIQKQMNGRIEVKR